MECKIMENQNLLAEPYTRVKIDTKQDILTGIIRIDILAEATTVKEACELVKDIIDRREKDITETMIRMKSEQLNKEDKI